MKTWLFGHKNILTAILAITLSLSVLVNITEAIRIPRIPRPTATSSVSIDHNIHYRLMWSSPEAAKEATFLTQNTEFNLSNLYTIRTSRTRKSTHRGFDEFPPMDFLTKAHDAYIIGRDEFEVNSPIVLLILKPQVQDASDLMQKNKLRLGLVVTFDHIPTEIEIAQLSNAPIFNSPVINTPPLNTFNMKGVQITGLVRIE